MDSRKTACVAFLCCAAFIAVAWVSSEDAAPTILEEANSPTKMPSLYKQTAALYEDSLLNQKGFEEQVPDTEFDSVSMSVVRKSFSKARRSVPMKRSSPWKRWRKYPFGGKSKALKKMYPKWFKKTNRACKQLRKSASRKCATHFCKAGAACGAPCVKRILQPPRMVIPLKRNKLDKSSPLWYQTSEVSHKEGHAKEQKSKELSFKRNRARREIHHERKAKEQEAKFDIANEKKAKAIAVKESAVKKRQSVELSMKVKEDKYKETAHKLNTKNKCSKKSDKIVTECNTKEDVRKTKVKKESEHKARIAHHKYIQSKKAEQAAVAKDKAAQAAAAKAVKQEKTDKAASQAASAASDKEKIGKNKALAHAQERKKKEEDTKEKAAKALEKKDKERSAKREKADKAAEKKKKEVEAKERGAKERVAKEKAAKKKELDNKEAAKKEKAAKEAAEKEKAHKVAMAEKADKEAKAKAAAKEKSDKEKVSKEKTHKKQEKHAKQEKSQKLMLSKCRGTSWCETFHTCLKGDGRNFYAWVKGQGYKQYKGACATSRGVYGHRHKYWPGSYSMSQCMAKCDAMGTSCQGITMQTSIDCSGRKTWKPFNLQCFTSTSSSNNAGIVRAGFSSGHWNQGYRMTGGGLVNHYRTFNHLSAFEEAFPTGDGNGYSGAYQCDTGFGPGRVTCYSTQCNVQGLSCTVKSARKSGSGVLVVNLPSGYTATGGGMYNHYRHWNKKAAFEESMPSGTRGWQCDMGLGSGDFTCYVRGCKASSSKRLSCLTRQSGPANYHTVSCPSGYSMTSCGQKENRRRWDHLSGFEAYNAHGNGCACDSGFGGGSNYCYARCCRMESLVAIAEASLVQNQKRKFVEVSVDGHPVKPKNLNHDWDYKWNPRDEIGTKDDNAIKQGNKKASDAARTAHKLQRELKTANKKAEKADAKAGDLANKDRNDNTLENNENKENVAAKSEESKDAANEKNDKKFEKEDEKKGYFGKADYNTNDSWDKDGKNKNQGKGKGKRRGKAGVLVGLKKVFNVGECAEKRRVAYEACDKASVYKSLVSEEDRAKHEFNVAAKTKKEADTAQALSRKRAAVAAALAKKLARANAALKASEDEVSKIAKKAAKKAKNAEKSLPKRLVTLMQMKSQCDWKCYLARYKDLQHAFGNNLARAKDHWFRHGKREGRNCTCPHAGFHLKYAKKWPHCTNLGACLHGSVEKFKLACMKQAACDGFSFTAGAKTGSGCLKTNCANDGKQGFGHGSHGYYEKLTHLSSKAGRAAAAKKEATAKKASESAAKSKAKHEAKAKTAAAKAAATAANNKAAAASREAEKKKTAEFTFKHLTKEVMKKDQMRYEVRQKKKLAQVRAAVAAKLARRVAAIKAKLHAENAAALGKKLNQTHAALKKHKAALKKQLATHAAQNAKLKRMYASMKAHKLAMAKDKAAQAKMRAKRKIYRRFWRNQGSKSCKAAIHKQHRACSSLLNKAYRKCTTMHRKGPSKKKHHKKHPKVPRWHSKKIAHARIVRRL